MPSIDLETNVGRSLEQLVEANGLHYVLDALASICYLKADKLEQRAEARDWLHAGRVLATTAHRTSIYRVTNESAT